MHVGESIYPPIQFITINKTPACFGTVPKHLGVIIIVMNCILLSAFVGVYTDWKNVHGMNNIKFAYGGVKSIA